MDLSSVDPYSCAKPGIAKVVHTHLDLFVDFDETVLRGEAILFISMTPGSISKKIILDMYEFDINKISVTDCRTDQNLNYAITKNVDNVGSKFIIWIPSYRRKTYSKYEYKYRVDAYWFHYNYKIQIKYETHKGSSALYWLRSDQTSDGTHPMLITNNKFTYARGVFPCQDSPSVRFTYTAEISVPKDFNFVMICGIKCKEMLHVGDRIKYIFYEAVPMPSYAIIIMVGSLEEIILCPYPGNISLWAEKKYIEQSKEKFAYITDMLKIAKALCGPLYEDEYNICVLPPNIPEIELQCLSMIFVSSTLLNEDSFIILNTVAQKIAQSWAGGLVTCTNFQHLWLIKSFSTFISRKIIHLTEYKHYVSYLERKTINCLKTKISSHDMIDCRLKLVPNLRDILPKDITKFVPDEIGYLLLNYLEQSLGGPNIFESYLKYYIRTYRFTSVNTDDWVNHLHYYFSDRYTEINSILYMWFYELDLSRIYTIYPHLFYQVGNERCLLAELWITTQTLQNFSPLLTKLKLYNNVERIEFLTILYASPTVLPIAKLRWLHCVLPLDEQTYENRLLLLRLYIKSKWLEMTQPALEFAREYCTPTFACPIFQDLYELEETRQLAISGFIAIAEKRCKMLPQTMEEVASILKINLKDIHVLNEESILHVKTEQ